MNITLGTNKMNNEDEFKSFQDKLEIHPPADIICMSNVICKGSKYLKFWTIDEFRILVTRWKDLVKQKILQINNPKGTTETNGKCTLYAFVVETKSQNYKTYNAYYFFTEKNRDTVYDYIMKNQLKKG